MRWRFPCAGTGTSSIHAGSLVLRQNKFQSRILWSRNETEIRVGFPLTSLPDESFSEGRDTFTGAVYFLGAYGCASTGVGIRGELSLDHLCLDEKGNGITFDSIGLPWKSWSNFFTDKKPLIELRLGWWVVNIWIYREYNNIDLTVRFILHHVLFTLYGCCGHSCFEDILGYILNDAWWDQPENSPTPTHKSH